MGVLDVVAAAGHLRCGGDLLTGNLDMVSAG
jgi:hypothetical protein